jgi:5-methylcytosine-specific restriction protein A
MPAALERSCHVLGCPNSQPCSVHQKRSTVKPAHHDLYNRQRWRRISRAFLKRHPRCGDRPGGLPAVMSQCRDEGRIVAAVIVDHVTPHKGDPRLAWDQTGNLQALCASCSGRKSKAGL